MKNKKIDWNNPEEVKEYKHQYYLINKKNIDEKTRDYRKKYYQNYWIKNKDTIKKLKNTPIVKAYYLMYNYKNADNKNNRGECTLTPEWIVDNIFTKPCHWCGETDWTKLGCDRIDNSKPHTPDNVVPCCYKCNKKRGRKDYEEFLMYIKEKATE